jgi:hypothetical protein
VAAGRAAGVGSDAECGRWSGHFEHGNCVHWRQLDSLPQFGFGVFQISLLDEPKSFVGVLLRHRSGLRVQAGAGYRESKSQKNGCGRTHGLLILFAGSGKRPFGRHESRPLSLNPLTRHRRIGLEGVNCKRDTIGARTTWSVGGVKRSDWNQGGHSWFRLLQDPKSGRVESDPFPEV